MIKIKQHFYTLDEPIVKEYRLILELEHAKIKGKVSYTDNVKLLKTLFITAFKGGMYALTLGWLNKSIKQDTVSYFNLDTYEPFDFGDDYSSEAKFILYALYYVGYRQKEIKEIFDNYYPPEDFKEPTREIEQENPEDKITEARKNFLSLYGVYLFSNSMAGSYMTMQEIDNLTIRDFAEIKELHGLIEDDGAKTNYKEYDENFAEIITQDELNLSTEDMLRIIDEIGIEGGEE